MNVHSYEKAFLSLGGVLLVACMGALIYSTLAMGIHLPGKVGEIDPEKLSTTAPFNEPGVRQTGSDSYEITMIGRVWAFVPHEVTVPVDADITITATSADVLHGLHVDGTRINMMLIPGQISRATYRFDEPGRYVIVCHEYCGVGHHTMYGTIIVE